ncbi:HK97 gp10 family phage protein [Emergencia timonensis]|uniref:HK97 gp10 family phage protein n=1 Tax=Emergencia timonensis TaxID=1776384 RepID=UPI0039F4B63B
MTVRFADNRIQVTEAMKDAALKYLHEASGELVSQAARETAVDTGQLKGSWNYKIDEGKLESMIGSPLENAIWEEFGTGEYALHGDGRKGGWVYEDAKGDWHRTKGKPPKRVFWKTYTSLKNPLIQRAKEIFKGL